MSGHSKWSTIKHKKAATDAKRGKVFTRIAKEITISARSGGGDPETNNALRLLVSKAKAANMPKDNIEKAIKRGTGEIEGGELVEAMYEVYAPHGIGLLVETVTDNRNRAIAELRHSVSKFGGNMADSGSVAWQFTRKGYIGITEDVDEDELFLIAAERMALPPRRCVVIEDAPNGIEAAKAAGTRCIAVTNTTPAAALTQADRICASLAPVHLSTLRTLIDGA